MLSVGPYRWATVLQYADRTLESWRRSFPPLLCSNRAQDRKSRPSHLTAQHFCPLATWNASLPKIVPVAPRPDSCSTFCISSRRGNGKDRFCQATSWHHDRTGEHSNQTPGAPFIRVLCE